jgi:hypothetical protein
MLINFQGKKITINPRALEAVTLYFKPKKNGEKNFSWST